MSTAKVIFERTLSDGLLAEIRVYLPSEAPDGFKLQFVNDRASITLPVDVLLHLVFELNGLEGDEIKINAKAIGIDDDFKAVLDSAKIPDDGNPTNFGERRNVRGAVAFVIKGAAE